METPLWAVRDCSYAMEWGWYALDDLNVVVSALRRFRAIAVNAGWTPSVRAGWWKPDP